MNLRIQITKQKERSMLFLTILHNLLLIALFVLLVIDILIVLHECAHAAVAVCCGRKITKFGVYGTLLYFEYDWYYGWNFEFFRRGRDDTIGGVVGSLGDSGTRAVAAAGPFMDWFVAGLLIGCAVFSFSFYVSIAALLSVVCAWIGYICRCPGDDYDIMCNGDLAV
jgi:hypothetical protein